MSDPKRLGRRVGLSLALLSAALVGTLALRASVRPAHPPVGAGAEGDGEEAFFAPSAAGSAGSAAPGDGRTGQAALRRLLPPPPGGAPLVAIGDQLSYGGLPMSLASFETEKDPESILRYYADHFRARGWSYAGAKQARQWVPMPALSATILEQDLQVSVMVMPHEGDARKTVVLSVADMRGLLDRTEGADAADFPRYPGSRPLALRARDGEVESLTVNLQTPDALERVADFYRQQFTRLGYEAGELEGAADPQLRQLKFQSARRTWSLTLSRHADATAVTAQAREHPLAAR